MLYGEPPMSAGVTPLSSFTTGSSCACVTPATIALTVALAVTAARAGAAAASRAAARTSSSAHPVRLRAPLARQGAPVASAASLSIVSPCCSCSSPLLRRSPLRPA